MSWMPALERCLTYVSTIREKAAEYDLNPDLITAIIFQESNGYPISYRVEKSISLTYMPNVFANKLFVSYDSEALFQNTSWGLMHIMGFKARELGYMDHLPLLLKSETAIDYGCKALASFKRIYPYEEDYIAAYNGGAGAVLKKTIIGYPNQSYVDDVKLKWSILEKKGLFV